MARLLGGRRPAETMALPGWVKPQLTKLVDQAPDGPEWLHEINSTAFECMPGRSGALSGF